MNFFLNTSNIKRLFPLLNYVSSIPDIKKCFEIIEYFIFLYYILIYSLDAEDQPEVLNELSNEEAEEDNDNDEDDDAYDSPVFGSALTPPDSPPFQASCILFFDFTKKCPAFQFHEIFLIFFENNFCFP